MSYHKKKHSFRGAASPGGLHRGLFRIWARIGYVCLIVSMIVAGVAQPRTAHAWDGKPLFGFLKNVFAKNATAEVVQITYADNAAGDPGSDILPDTNDSSAFLSSPLSPSSGVGQDSDIFVQENTNEEEDYFFALLSPVNDAAFRLQGHKTRLHSVQDSETLSAIAVQYGVTVESILWANALSNPNRLKPGDTLVIPPITGVLHVVRKGDTVSSIAKKYKADPQEILTFNLLPADGTLQIGETIAIPGGSIPPPPPAPRQPARKSAPSIPSALPQIAGFFALPTIGTTSGRLHAQNGVDFNDGTSDCGHPIFASADGTVTEVNLTDSRGTWVNGGYGNMVKILHPNGSTTVYGHLLAGTVLVNEGQTVTRGQQVAQMGGGWDRVEGKRVRMMGAGYSTGCHLHFEVRGAVNPFGKYRGRR